jgi:hypothetical protein
MSLPSFFRSSMTLAKDAMGLKIQLNEVIKTSVYDTSLAD